MLTLWKRPSAPPEDAVAPIYPELGMDLPAQVYDEPVYAPVVNEVVDFLRTNGK